MANPSIQTSFAAGELAPSLFGHVDYNRYSIGASTMRNLFVSWRGGAFSRAGTRFVGYSKQTTSTIGTRATGSIGFTLNLTDGQTITLNGVVWTFVTSGAVGDQSNIGGNLGGTLVLLFIALNESSNPALSVATYTKTGSGVNPGALVITYDSVGTVGNAYTLAASVGTPSSPTLTGGTDASALTAPPRLIPFQFNLNQGLCLEFGNEYMRVISEGAFVLESSFNITSITQDDPGSVTAPGNDFANGDWVYISNAGGMTEVNGQTYVIDNIVGATFDLYDVFGNAINTAAFTGYTLGGTVARVFTLTTPYDEADLQFIKYTQSADVMSLCCRNQETGDEYAPQELVRFADDNWTIAPLDTSASIAPPANPTGNATVTGSPATDYQYVITAVDRDTGEESVASGIINIDDSVNIGSTAGSEELFWDVVGTASYYNIYKAPPAYDSTVPIGSLFGYAGSAYGTNFVDSNIIQDMSQVPPLHKNPFAAGQVISVTVSTPGSGMTTCTAGITTSTGSGAVLTCVLVGGAGAAVLTAVIVENPGENYDASDTVTFTPNAGVAPTGTLNIGPASGTFPSVVAYFQQRRAYANSFNQPDTYWMSQAGAYTNFDSRIPTIDTDAITGSPWSVQVDGIQFMVPMPVGLVVLTGAAAYQLTGAGGSPSSPQAITPSSQQATPQAFNGCHYKVPPVRIDYDVYYLQALGSVIRNLSYNFWINTFTGVDVTYLSSHLFTDYVLLGMAWSEEPYKILWVVRNDGILLSLTSLKSQEVMAWARHDTQGLFLSCCSIIEPPVDSLYLATQRFTPDGESPFMIERLDNRLWTDIEGAWCVDCALQLAQPEPNATLTVSSATGLGELIGTTSLTGGAGYSALTTAAVIDPTGTGAAITLTIVAGAITALVFTDGGEGYTSPRITFNDPNSTGAGAAATPLLLNSSNFQTSSAIFSAGMVGWVIRAGGGKATISSYVNSRNVICAMTSPIVQVIPNTGGRPRPFASGDWTLSEPVTTISGLNHLVGMTVTGLADGIVIEPRVVDEAGEITLDNSATAVTVGLGFQAQLQTLYLDSANPTEQGRRKKIGGATARVESSQAIKVGSNQPDGSVQSPMQVETTWTNMQEPAVTGPNLAQPPYGTASIQGSNNVRAVPLFTGDIHVKIASGSGEKPGQVALQQDYPLPMQILAVIPESQTGDSPEPRPRGR